MSALQTVMCRECLGTGKCRFCDGTGKEKERTVCEYFSVDDYLGCEECGGNGARCIDINYPATPKDGDGICRNCKGRGSEVIPSTPPQLPKPIATESVAEKAASTLPPPEKSIASESIVEAEPLLDKSIGSDAIAEKAAPTLPPLDKSIGSDSIMEEAVLPLFDKSIGSETIAVMPAWVKTWYGLSGITLVIVTSCALLFWNPGRTAQFTKVSTRQPPSWLQTMAENSSKRWFWLLAPLRLVLSPLADASLCGHYAHRFTHMTEPPPALPSWDEATKDNITADEQAERTVFWSTILFIKAMLLVLTTSMWHLFLVRLPSQSDFWKGVAHTWRKAMKSALKPCAGWTRMVGFIQRVLCCTCQDHLPQYLVHIFAVFLMYHLLHHMILCMLVLTAVSYGLMSDASGVDWEFWSTWLDWLLVVLNATAIGKYTTYEDAEGRPLPSSEFDILCQVIPGVGADMHLFKDWIFVGLCIQMTRSANILALKLFSAMLGFCSVVFMFLPLVGICRNAAAAETFIVTHWPIIKVRPMDSTSSRSSCKDFLFTQAARQSTVARQLVATRNELPQAIVEFALGIAFGFKSFILVAIFSSLLKVIGIPVLRRFTARSIAIAGAAPSLVQFARSHGFVEAPEFAHGGTALHAALQNHTISEAVDDLLGLLDNQPSSTALLQFADQLGNCPLHYAIKLGSTSIATKLLERLEKVDVEVARSATDKHNNEGETPLHIALTLDSFIFETDVKTCLRLIKAGGGINAKTTDKEETPLHLATRSAARRNAPAYLILDHLIRNSADVTIASAAGETPLHLALKSGASAEICHLLIATGGGINAQTRDEGDTPLHLSFKITIEGAIAGRSAMTSIATKALIQRNAFITEALIQRNADVRMKNIKGERPIDFVLEHLDTVFKEIKALFPQEVAIAELEKRFEQRRKAIRQKAATDIATVDAEEKKAIRELR